AARMIEMTGTDCPDAALDAAPSADFPASPVFPQAAAAGTAARAHVVRIGVDQRWNLGSPRMRLLHGENDCPTTAVPPEKGRHGRGVDTIHHQRPARKA